MRSKQCRLPRREPAKCKFSPGEYQGRAIRRGGYGRHDLAGNRSGGCRSLRSGPDDYVATERICWPQRAHCPDTGPLSSYYRAAVSTAPFRCLSKWVDCVMAPTAAANLNPEPLDFLV